jgi:hypothetical protein
MGQVIMKCQRCGGKATFLLNTGDGQRVCCKCYNKKTGEHRKDTGMAKINRRNFLIAVIVLVAIIVWSKLAM